MDAAEYELWRQLWRGEPWGEYRTDLGAALVAAVMANAWGKRRVNAQDLMPRWWRDPEGERPQDVETQKLFALQHCLALGGTFVRAGG